MTRCQRHLAHNRQSPHPITAAGLDQRFTAEAEEFLQRLVEHALQPGVANHLGHARGVYGLDGTKVRVYDQQYQLLTRLNLTTGAMTWQHTTQVQHENRFALTHEHLPAGALRLADLGFFHLETFAQRNRERVYWLTRYDHNDQPLDLSACLG